MLRRGSVSARCKMAWPKERVMAYLSEGAGSQFDPKIVPAFLDLIQQNG